MKDDPRFVDVTLQPEQQTCILASMDEYVRLKMQEERSKMLEQIVKRDEEVHEAAASGLGPRRVAVQRRKAREEAEGTTRMTDDTTVRERVSTRPREQDGEDEGEREKEEEKAKQENEIGRRQEAEKKEAEEVQRKLKEESKK